MSKLDSIQDLRLGLELLRDTTSKLDSELFEIMQCIREERFIPEALKEETTETLTQIGTAQEGLKTGFEELSIGECPQFFHAFTEKLDELQKETEATEKYINAIKFFLTLHSNEVETQRLLEERKEKLSKIPIESLKEDDLKEYAGDYLLLQAAFYEQDQSKKFSYLYKLSSVFEEEIAQGIFFGKIESISEKEDSVDSQPEEADLDDALSEVAVTLENATESEPEENALDNDKSIETQPEMALTEQNNNETVSEEAGEDLEQQSSEPEEDPDEEDSAMEITEEDWESIQIKDKSLLLHKEDPRLLKIQVSAKAEDKFGANKFKNDIMKKPFVVEKIACFMEASEASGYSLQSLETWRDKESRYFDAATDKLFHLGYLKRYEIEGMGDFYVLSPRGEKALGSKEAMSFINTFTAKKSFTKEDHGDVIEESANAAMARILCNTSCIKMKLLYEDYKFVQRSSEIKNDFFFYKFPIDKTDEDIAFMGIVSEDYNEFSSVYEDLKREDHHAKRNIVIEDTLERAQAVGKWVSSVLDQKCSVWYCKYNEDDFYDAITDELVVLNGEQEECTETEEKIIQEPVKDIQEEVPSMDEDIIQEPEASSEKTDTFSEEITDVTVGSEQEEADLSTEEITTDDPAEAEPKTPIEVHSFEPAANHKKLEQTEEDFTSEYQEMLASEQFYCATAYLKTLVNDSSDYEHAYQQLAYALNDPMAECNYSSDTIFSVYYEEELVSDYYVVSAAIRNYFYDQFRFDYSLPQLQATLSGNEVLTQFPAVDKVVYTLQKFKAEQNHGVDRYADYREIERASWEIRLENTKREAKSFYENYCIGTLKENTSHMRFMETEKLLLKQGSDLSEYLQMVSEDNRELLSLLESFLKQTYIKEGAVICKENIDASKLEAVLDEYWDRAAQNLRFVKKTSDLMGSLRMNLFKKVRKVVATLCDYVSLINSAVPTDSDPALREYKKIRNTLLEDVKGGIAELGAKEEDSLETRAGKAVLREALHEIQYKMEGNFKDETNKYFYIGFLKNDKVVLDEDYLPVLDEVLELPDFSIRNRIKMHCSEKGKDWEKRLTDIFTGEDDYGSAALILNYIQAQNIRLENTSLTSFSLEDAIVYPQKDIENKRKDFIEDLELAQSYGQIDNTVENSKENIIQIMETWYAWAKETKNFGFFNKILCQFKTKIHKDAEIRAVELNRNLEAYLKQNPEWKEEKALTEAVSQVKDRIEQQNYAAAEDLLNRMVTNDLQYEEDLQKTDYLNEFFEEYDLNYKRTANAGTSLKSLLHTSKFNKDTKGANRLLENWPRSNNVGENTIRMLLNALGFHTDTVQAEAPLQGKIESYLVTLKRPQNGRKSNYKHPISAFGSEAEENGFRVVCLFGKTDASRLIDTFREIGNAKHTLVLLDYALTLAERRTLARKTKTDLSGKIFAVIDRVTLLYLANHYSETAVNRMLMYVIMPFASYQPYIFKSADVMPPEIFIGRKTELEKIESPSGVNLVYGGRQLGKTALLRMAKKDINMDENGDRAVIVTVWGKDYRETARIISAALYDEGILKKENITEDWTELARDIKNRLRDTDDYIPYFLLMIDEADVFIESCESIQYQPFEALKEIQSIGTGRFKFVVAGLRNIVRFKRTAALGNNSVLTHLDSLTVKPFKTMEARELLEGPLSYLGFRFPNDNETEVLISTIFGTTNYFPGLIQLYCTKLIEAMRRNYSVYAESETPPYYVRTDHIKKVLADQSLQDGIREKFFITLKVGDDDYYYILALLVAYYYHKNRSQNGCNAKDMLDLANTFSIKKISELEVEKISALMEEMCELNVLQHTGNDRYRFTRHSFCQMMGTEEQIEDELLNYMED